jgi:trimethylamine--corrinoid protein Co-methyltransferase
MSKASMVILSKNEIEMVHETSLRMLSEIGYKIDSSKVLDMLAKAGVRTDRKKQLIFLDERLVNDALKSAPRSIKICSRGGRDYTIPQDGVQLVSTDGQPAAVLDLGTGRRRPSTLKDAVDFAILADALPEVDFIWPPVVATDMPSDRSSYYEFLVTIAHSSKHIQHAAANENEANFQIDIGAAILGSKEELRRRPIFSDVVTPISPLRYDEGGVEGLVALAKAGIPLVQLSMGIAGSVTPVSIAGTLAVINAENLCGLTISQITSPGAPSIYSSFSGVTDLKSGVFLCGTPEGILIDVAGLEMANHYGLPTCVGGPANASRALSVEAGYQSGMTAMASVLAGSDMMVGLGGLDRDSMVSPEKLVLDCEVWRWMERLREGITVDAGTLGFDAMKRQGPGGTFLSDPHTLKFMRKELMIPQVTGYHLPGEPDHSVDDLVEYSKKKTKEILKTHKPPLLDKATADRVGAVAKKYGIVFKDGKQIFPHA